VQYCYNIHDIVRIKSDVQLYELEYFACEEFSDNIADMVVIVSSNMPLRGIHLKKKLVGNNLRLIMTKTTAAPLHLAAEALRFA
jgi:hypothetical protein